MRQSLYHCHWKFEPYFNDFGPQRACHVSRARSRTRCLLSRFVSPGRLKHCLQAFAKCTVQPFILRLLAGFVMRCAGSTISSMCSCTERDRLRWYPLGAETIAFSWSNCSCLPCDIAVGATCWVSGGSKQGSSGELSPVRDCRTILVTSSVMSASRHPCHGGALRIGSESVSNEEVLL